MTSGSVSVEITTADMTGLLSKLNAHGIILHKLSFIDMLTASMEISRNDLSVLQKISFSYGASVKIVKKNGAYWAIQEFLKRPVLLLGLCVHLFFILWLPTRILFISVEGNKKIPTQKIIEQANLCGIRFGVSRRTVRSEKMKNSLLSAIPSLQWAGINTSGCTAVISVRERKEQKEQNTDSGVCSIVAGKDGVVLRCSALRGEHICKAGQAVQKGDILISGYIDLGLCVKGVHAAGEIYAQTKNEIHVITPTDYLYKGTKLSTEKIFGLLIGKKRIFFNKGSGISGVGCDRIYLEYYMTLPGGYRLPFALFVSATAQRNTSVISDVGAAQDAAERTARTYLLSKMISGQILQEDVVLRQQGDVFALFGRYICSEMIGRVQHEGLYGKYGESNG